MKPGAFLLLLLLFLVPACATTRTAKVEPLRVMTFNIRFDNPGDGPDAWPLRREKVATTILDSGADIIGVQEAQPHQLRELQALLPGFTWVGVGRDADLGGEHSAIFYRQDRLEVVESGTFWLSETPEVAGSKAWDAALPRIVTWGFFRDRTTGSDFHLFNTHFDHVGEDARRESANLLSRRIGEMTRGDGPVIVTGDLNTTPDSLPLTIFRKEARVIDARATSATPPQGPDSTWTAFRAIEPGRRIDFILVNDAVTVESHEIIDRTFDGRFPSDHLPVIAELKL